MKSTATSEKSEINAEALSVHRRAVIVDGHCDTPYRLLRTGHRFDTHDPEAQVDLNSLMSSGLTASFFVSYVPPFYANRGAAAFAHRLIDIIDGIVAAHPEQLRLATRPEHILEAKHEGRVGIMIGIEGGHAIEDSLEVLESLFSRGARYMTLTHVNTNNWADSSGDAPRHGGLAPFGREVVRHMNRLGMLVDVSHVADTTFYNVLETSSVPVFASHSSCRSIARHPRNLTDEMLKDLATARGLCMINFFSAFIDDIAAQTMMGARKTGAKPQLPPNEEEPDDAADWDSFCRWYAGLGAPPGTLDTVVDHIVHAATVAGVDVVGLGSDFDGVPMLPTGLENAARLPWLTERMLERGFHPDEVEKILGGNFVRLFGEVTRD